MELSRSRRGLQKKFVASLLIVRFAPGIVALFATYLYSIQTIKTSIGGSFQQIAASTARRIEVMIDDEIDSARHLAATPLTVRASIETANNPYRTEDPQATRTRLLQRSAQWERYRTGGDRSLPSFIHRGTLFFLRDWFAIRAGEYQNVLVTDERGALVASVAPTVGYLHRDELWWREAFADGHGRLYVSDIYKQAEGEYLLDIAVPVMDAVGKRAIGVVKLELRRANLMKAIMEIKVGERGHGMLLNTEGTPLICPVLPPKAHLINDPLMRQLMQMTPGWVVAEDDAHGGHNSIVGYAPIRFTHPLSESSLGGHQWYAFVRQDPAETYAPVYTLLRTVGMIGFGMVTALASLGFFVGRLFVKPILLLQEQADAIRQSVQDLASAARFDRALGSGPSIAEEVRIGSDATDLMVDPDQVKEGLVNLLINAREAMPQGGTLTIVADMEGKSDAPATVVVRIVDTGCGISAEHLKQIFNPFFTTKDYGTGLGLTNAKRLVEQNGGQLAIHSHEGKGTEVVIRLPALGR